MEVIVINPDGLDIFAPIATVNRVKALIINSHNEILLAHVDDVYTFVGGHVSDGESLNSALIREVQEETSLDIQKQVENPFLKIASYDKNHFKSGKACLSQIYYYVIYSDEKINLSKLKLDPAEKKHNFFLRYMNLNDFYDYLLYQTHILKSKLHEEMLMAYECYFQSQYRSKKDEKKLQIVPKD